MPLHSWGLEKSSVRLLRELFEAAKAVQAAPLNLQLLALQEAKQVLRQGPAAAADGGVEGDAVPAAGQHVQGGLTSVEVPNRSCQPCKID